MKNEKVNTSAWFLLSHLLAGILSSGFRPPNPPAGGVRELYFYFYIEHSLFDIRYSCIPFLISNSSFFICHFSEINRRNAFVFAEVFDEVGGLFKTQVVTNLFYAL